MTMPITIRDARPNELDLIRDITLAAYDQYARIMEPSAWEGLKAAILEGLSATGPMQRIVAEEDGKVVGSAMLFYPQEDLYGGQVADSGVPELRLLSVLPDARDSGIGQALVDECVRRARQMGARELGLHTSKSMEAAIHIYEQMGFYRVPENDFQPPGAELVMGYRLKLPDEAI